MAYLLLLCQVTLAVVLCLAVTGKVLSSAQFMAVLRLSHLPEPLVMPSAILTPAVELFAGLALVLAPSPALPAVMGATLVLLALFTAWMIGVYVRGLRLKCGCFGAGGAEIGPPTIGRNAALMLIALCGLLLAFQAHSPLPSLSLWTVIGVVSIAMCVVLVQAFFFGQSALILTVARLQRLDEERLRAPTSTLPQAWG